MYQPPYIHLSLRARIRDLSLFTISLLDRVPYSKFPFAHMCSILRHFRVHFELLGMHGPAPGCRAIWAIGNYRKAWVPARTRFRFRYGITDGLGVPGGRYVHFRRRRLTVQLSAKLRAYPIKTINRPSRSYCFRPLAPLAQLCFGLLPALDFLPGPTCSLNLTLTHRSTNEPRTHPRTLQPAIDRSRREALHQRPANDRKTKRTSEATPSLLSPEQQPTPTFGLPPARATPSRRQ